MSRFDAVLMWFRRDLRCDDNAALYAALKSARRVHCVFVYDTDILDALPSRADRRVEFIVQSVNELAAALGAAGGALLTLHGEAKHEIPRLAQKLGVQAVFANRDYEPQAVARDAAVAAALGDARIEFSTRKDQVIFEQDEVMTLSGTPFSVFTPYKNAWLKKIEPFHVKAYPVADYLKALAPGTAAPRPLALADIGFQPTNLAALGISGGSAAARRLLADFTPRMARYREARDFPAKKGPSYLSVHLRFGTISVRELARAAWPGAGGQSGEGAATWLSELVWRDFYFMILHHHPHVVSGAFKPAYDAIRWPGEDRLFRAWCEARTGYPIVDAAMRQINQTGYMHNRLRMIVASFLVKDLLVDWRRGERYFADHLNDFDLAANNGGWQWAASTGCDAQPYFRIFNPVSQSQKFDASGDFIRRYLPELKDCDNKAIHAPWLMMPLEQQAAGVVIGRDYPAPVVDHAVARTQALALFKAVKG
ncbi:MAG: cryptochrome/photolyase family protein [Betaproteobacteria bacterium]|jgi:deoxyribodipyrimidine photo-lyase|nr:DNA photolyase family protein [Betaproteobacteria bacterium]